MFKKLSMLLFFVTAMGFASALTYTVNGINYNVTSGSTNAQVSYNSTYKGDIIIPATVIIAGTTYSVTSIAIESFYNLKAVTSVTIPDSVTSIGDSAFEACTGLTSITIPNSVTSMGKLIFQNCYYLTSVTISNGVTSILDSSFRNCLSLKSVTIPNSVTQIGPAAFYSCGNLQSIIIPDSVTQIGSSAFGFCSSLTSIKIPNSVTSIGNGAFTDCISLISVNCDIVNPLSISSSVFYNVTQNTCTLTVPAASVADYQAADVWKNFNPIVGDATLRTSELNSKNNVALYPNPVHNEAILELKNSENAKLEVFDMNGKMVLRKSLNNNAKNTVNISNLPKGIYLFKVGKSVTKVIKD